MTTTEAFPPAVVSLRSPAIGVRRLKDVAFKGFLLTSLGLALGVLLTLLVNLFVPPPQIGNCQLVRACHRLVRPEPASSRQYSASIWVVGSDRCNLASTWRQRSVVPRGVCQEGSVVQPIDRAQHPEPCCSPVDRLRDTWPGVRRSWFAGWGFTVGTAALILSMVVLPTVVIASREAIRAVPSSLRQGGLALGATRWQTCTARCSQRRCRYRDGKHSRHITRARRISTVADGRRIDVRDVQPVGFDCPYTVLPLQIFRYFSEARAELKPLAAASAVVLLMFLVLMNSAAILLRNRFQRKLVNPMQKEVAMVDRSKEVTRMNGRRMT